MQNHHQREAPHQAPVAQQESDPDDQVDGPGQIRRAHRLHRQHDAHPQRRPDPGADVIGAEDRARVVVQPVGVEALADPGEQGDLHPHQDPEQRSEGVGHDPGGGLQRRHQRPARHQIRRQAVGRRDRLREQDRRGGRRAQQQHRCAAEDRDRRLQPGEAGKGLAHEPRQESADPHRDDHHPDHREDHRFDRAQHASGGVGEQVFVNQPAAGDHAGHHDHRDVVEDRAAPPPRRRRGHARTQASSPLNTRPIPA